MTQHAWDCGSCGHHNDGGALCEVCGVAKRYLDEPPVDLPFPPRLTALPAFYGALLWGAAALLGLGLLAMPAWRTAWGLGSVTVTLGLASALGAAWTSLSEALWRRVFNEMRFEVPATVRSGDDFEAALTLVPYDRVRSVHVSFALVDTFFQRQQGGGVTIRHRRLGRQIALRGEPLSGRHPHELKALFAAPFPATRHSDILAEALATLLEALAWLVPGLALAARNLHQHGGYYVSATIRLGWLRRTFKQRVVAYYIGSDLYVG